MVKYSFLFKSLAFLFSLFILSIFFFENTKSLKEFIEPFEPLGSGTTQQAIGNSFILLLITLLASIFLITFIKINKKFFIELLIIYLPLFSVFFILQLFFQIIFDNSIIGIIFSFVLIIVAYLSYIKRNKFLFTISLIFISSSISTYFTIVLSIDVLLFLIIVFVIYDIVAVFKGPLKVLIKEMKVKRKIVRKESLFAFGFLFSNVLGIGIGTGDFIFYSLILLFIYQLKGIFSSIISFIFLYAGFLLTLYLLEKYKRPLPGLPLPLTLALLSMLLT
ncbi:MAG: hypothetical protein QXJ14_00840 [Candidatus Aenigmatarchaeota archaeon]